MCGRRGFARGLRGNKGGTCNGVTGMTIWTGEGARDEVKWGKGMENVMVGGLIVGGRGG